MLQSLKDLQDYTLRTTDGDLGEIDDFLFDDFNWTVRYIIIDVGDRKVMLSTHVLGMPDFKNHILPIKMDRDQILTAPQMNLNEPITRGRERELSEFFSWPRYWEDDDILESLPGDLTAVPLVDMETEKEPMIPQTGDLGDEDENHLFSARGAMGFAMEARDGTAGKLADFIIQDEDWDLHYLVVDTGGLFSGKKVLVSPQWVRDVDWDNSLMQVDLEKQTVHDSPAWSSSSGVTPEYWTNVEDHYKHS